jgi:hypothetical protein
MSHKLFILVVLGGAVAQALMVEFGGDFTK